MIVKMRWSPCSRPPKTPAPPPRRARQPAKPGFESWLTRSKKLVKMIVQVCLTSAGKPDSDFLLIAFAVRRQDYWRLNYVAPISLQTRGLKAV